MYTKVMVPLDGSELAECVLPHVEAFIKGFSPQSMIFVRVVEPMQVGTGGHYDTARLVNINEEENKRQESAREYLNEVTARLTHPGTEFKVEVLRGRVAERLVDFADENQIDLVLIATHGRSGVSRWVRGSIADRILRSFHAPVFMVRAPGSKGGV